MTNPTNEAINTTVFNRCQREAEGADYYQLFGELDKVFFEGLGGVEVDDMLEDSLDDLIKAGRLVEVETGRKVTLYLYRVAE